MPPMPPMPVIDTLPFEATAEATAAWLTAIDRLLLAEKVNALNGVLNELGSTVIEQVQLLTILDTLTESVLMTSKLLEHSAKSPDCTEEKSRRWMGAAMQLPKKLGFLYAHLAQENVLSESQRALCAFRALQILSLLCKRYTLFYEAPDLSLWKKFAELYLLADTQKWLTLKIDDRVTGLLRQPAIEDVVKHALVFYGCHPYRYAESEIASIFAAAADLTHWLRLDPAPSDFDMCSWIPDTFLPPQCANSQNPEAPVISINTSDLIDHFERHPEASKKLKMFPGLLNRLTAYHDVRCSVDPARPNRCGLIMGNAQASKFLNLLISRYRVLELTDSLEKHIKTTKLELVPLEIRNTMASLSSKILTDVKNISSRQLTIFETNESAFCTAKIAHAECSVDEPAILVLENQPPCFAVIRHMRSDSNIKFKNLLLERIDGEVYPLEIGEDQAFIVRRSSSEKTELFLLPKNRFSKHTVLRNIKGIVTNPLRIEKMIEFNAHFARYLVRFC